MASRRGAQVGCDVNPLVESFERIGSTWRLVVLDRLYGEEMRFNELKRSVDANSRTLARVLDELTEEGLVDRRVEEAAPVASYYRLTEKGAALQPVFESLETWGEEWLAATE